MKKIAINQIEGFRIGHAGDEKYGTGCSVILCGRDGAAAGVDIRGGGPASRETPLLFPEMACQAIHALVLSGGSAYGLEAGCGVMEYLKERDIGFDTTYAKVPLVVQSCIYDLGVGEPAWPDKAMAREACVDAEANNADRHGCVGAGIGATVGKYRGEDFMMKSGFGSCAYQIGDLQIGAVVAVNAFGDIYDAGTGKKIAGLLNAEKNGFDDTVAEMVADYEKMTAQGAVTNTTIGAVLTNAAFSKSELKKIASMTHNGYARSIRPVHTMMDGDTIYALASGKVPCNLDFFGTMAAEVMSQAIADAVLSATSLFGLKTAGDFVDSDLH